MLSKNAFTKEFFKHTRRTGSITPSSRFLAQKMFAKIDFDSTKVIVELGPGNGVFTNKIISKLRTDATLLIFELNEFFCEELKKKIDDPRVHIIHDSAEHISVYLEKYNLEKADVVLSSLPLANFSAKLKISILEAAKNALKLDGLFVQFQYSIHTIGFFKQFYSDISLGHTFLNLPPAFVYSCRKT